MINMEKMIVLLLMIVCFFVVGCTSTSDPTGKVLVEDDVKKVDLVVTKIGFNPVFYPIENEKVPMPEGIEIRIIKAGYSQAELYSLSSDHPMVGVLSNINVGRAYDYGMIYKVLAPYYREGPGPDGMTMGQLVGKKDSGINLLSDLYGKKVGIQGESDGSTIAMKTAMRKMGVDLSQIEFVAVQSELVPALVTKGELDAAMFDSDYILTSDFDDEYETVMDFGKILYEIYGVVPPAKFFVVREDMYEDNPDLYDAVVQFFRDNLEWSNENIEEITKLQSQKTGDDYDFLILKSNYATRLDKITSKDVEAYEDFYETALQEGVIDNIPDLEKIFRVEE